MLFRCAISEAVLDSIPKSFAAGKLTGEISCEQAVNIVQLQWYELVIILL